MKTKAVKQILLIAVGVMVAGYVLNKAGNVPFISDARDGLGGI